MNGNGQMLGEVKLLRGPFEPRLRTLTRHPHSEDKILDALVRYLCNLFMDAIRQREQVFLTRVGVRMYVLDREAIRGAEITTPIRELHLSVLVKVGGLRLLLHIGQLSIHVRCSNASPLTGHRWK